MLVMSFWAGRRLSSLGSFSGSTLLGNTRLGVRWRLLVKGRKTVACADVPKEVKEWIGRLVLIEDACHYCERVVEQNVGSCVELSQFSGFQKQVSKAGWSFLMVS
jgi:hypothetical protein